MPNPTTSATHDAPGTVREFEGDTVEEALANVTSELGTDARIVDVERVARGGVGGFFARETVVVRATPAPAMQRTAGDVVKEARTGGLDAVLTQMAAEQDAAERDFRSRLEQHMDRAPAAAEARGFERVAWPAVEPQATTAVVEEEVDDADVEVVAPAPAPAPSAVAAPATVPAALERPVEAPTPTSPAPTQESARADATAAPSPVASTVADARPRTAATAPERTPIEARDQRPAARRESGRSSRTPETPRRAITLREERPALPSPSRHDPSLDAPAGAGGVEWSALNLQRIGLPASVVDAVWNLRSTDDFVWLRAVADAVRLFCRPLPTGASTLAGPRAKRLAEALDLPAVKKGEAPPYGGHVGIQCKDHKTDRTWLTEVAGERWLHVVIGGHGWQGLLFDDPLAVSWVGAEELPEALDLCAKLGLVLGYGMATDTKDAIALRATPFEVALTIRSLLPRT